MDEEIPSYCYVLPQHDSTIIEDDLLKINSNTISWFSTKFSSQILQDNKDNNKNNNKYLKYNKKDDTTSNNSSTSNHTKFNYNTVYTNGLDFSRGISTDILSSHTSSLIFNQESHSILLTGLHSSTFRQVYYTQAILRGIVCQATSQLLASLSLVGGGRLTLTWFKISPNDEEVVTDVLRSSLANISANSYSKATNLRLKEAGPGRGFVAQGVWEIEIANSSEVETLFNEVIYSSSRQDYDEIKRNSSLPRSSTSATASSSASIAGGTITSSGTSSDYYLSPNLIECHNIIQLNVKLNHLPSSSTTSSSGKVPFSSSSVPLRSSSNISGGPGNVTGDTSPKKKGAPLASEVDPPNTCRLSFIILGNLSPYDRQYMPFLTAKKNTFSSPPSSPFSPKSSPSLSSSKPIFFPWIKKLSNIMRQVELFSLTPAFHHCKISLILRDIVLRKQKCSSLLLLEQKGNLHHVNLQWLYLHYLLTKPLYPKKNNSSIPYFSSTSSSSSSSVALSSSESVTSMTSLPKTTSNSFVTWSISPLSARYILQDSQLIKPLQETISPTKKIRFAPTLHNSSILSSSNNSVNLPPPPPTCNSSSSSVVTTRTRLGSDGEMTISSTKMNSKRRSSISDTNTDPLLEFNLSNIVEFYQSQANYTSSTLSTSTPPFAAYSSSLPNSYYPQSTYYPSPPPSSSPSKYQEIYDQYPSSFQPNINHYYTLEEEEVEREIVNERGREREKKIEREEEYVEDIEEKSVLSTNDFLNSLNI